MSGNWVTWQVTAEGEQWLKKSGFRDGESLDLELLEMFLDKGWLYTGGSGPGVALDGARPSFIKVGEGVKHQEFGIGEIRELLKDGACRVVFFKEYPDTREVPTEELSAARSIELARERSAAYGRAEGVKPSAELSVVDSDPVGVAAQDAGRAGTNRTSLVAEQASRSSGCLSLLAGVALLGLLVISIA